MKVLAFLKSVFIQSQAEKDRNHLKLMSIIKTWSLSCNRCNRLATPILGMEDRYQCSQCNRQFSGSKHEIYAQIAARIEQRIVSRWTSEDYDLCVERVTRDN